MMGNHASQLLLSLKTPPRWHEMIKETVRIPHCPHCRGLHAYTLEVARAIMLEVLTTHKRHKQPSRVKIARPFVCPRKSEHYQASFYLHDTSSDSIRAVSVIGLGEETE